MNNYLELLEKLGIKLENLSVKIKKKINQLTELKAILAELLKSYDVEENEKKKAAFKADFDETTAIASQLEEEICKDITRWDKHKDMYAKNAENLKKGRGEKTPPAPVATPPVVETQTSPVPDPVETPIINNSAHPELKKEKKKKSGWGWFIGVLLVGIAGAAVGVTIHNKGK